MRVPNAKFLELMRSAVLARMTEGLGLPDDPLLLNGLTTLAARAIHGARTVEWMRDEVRALAARVADLAPRSIEPRGAELAALLSPSPAAETDPAVYFRRALNFFADIVGDLGAAGRMEPASLPLAAEIAEWETRIHLAKLPPPADAMATGSVDAPLTASFIERFIASQESFGPDAKVTRFEEITGGMSKQAYRLTIDSEKHGTQQLILKHSAGEPIAAIDCMQLHREFGILKTVSALGLMVPRPLCLGRSVPGAGGDFFIMEASPGSCTSSFLTTSAPIPKPVLLQIASEMARLHTIGLDRLAAFIDEYESPEVFSATADQMVATRLEKWRELRQSFVRTPSPVEEYLLSWLFQNIPENKARPSLIHHDLVPHNCLWEGDRLTAVLDWEGAHFGDPAEDLAYAKPHIEQRMEWSEFVSHYEACGGPRISARNIEYHNCYSNFRSLLIANVLVTKIPPGSGDLRPLIVDSAFSGMFIDICMSSARNFERLGRG